MNPVHTEDYSFSIFTCCHDFNPTVIRNVMMEEKWLFCKVLREICGMLGSRSGWVDLGEGVFVWCFKGLCRTKSFL